MNLSRAVSGILAESYTIKRSTGSFQIGGWTTTSSDIPGWGVVSVASDDDLQIVPEGDRVTGMMVFHSVDEIFETMLEGSTQRVSDVMVWNNMTWRVIKVWPYPNRGYWKAVASRLSGV